jgi:hypothetical protein
MTNEIKMKDELEIDKYYVELVVNYMLQFLINDNEFLTGDNVRDDINQLDEIENELICEEYSERLK